MTDKEKLTQLRATAPMGLEDVSEDAWKEFQALRAAQEQAFEATKPMSNLTPLGRSGASAAPSVDGKGGPSIEQAIALAKRNNRVCPNPGHWAQMYALMVEGMPPNNSAPPVIDGPAWNIVPAMQKRLRLAEQLEWCERNAALGRVATFLQALPEEDWFHFG